MSSSKKPIQFHAGYPLAQQLLARNERPEHAANLVARRDLERWYGALDAVLRTLVLGPAQMLLLAQVVAAFKAGGGTDTALLVEELPDALRNVVAPGFGHVREPLAQMAAGWELLQRWAAVDAAERYLIQEREGGTTAEVLHRIGLNPYMEAK